MTRPYPNRRASLVPLLIISACATLRAAPAPSDAATSAYQLWYGEPAKKWDEALPVGSGRLGAMVFGGVAQERIQFNEDTLWTGKPHNYDRPGAIDHLNEIRQLVFAGKDEEAGKVVRAGFLSDPVRQKAYQPFGDIRLSFAGHDGAKQYRRQLDLDTAVATTQYEVDGVTFTREVFASHPANAIVTRISASKPGQVSFRLKLDSPHKESHSRKVDDSTLALNGQVRDVVPPNEMGMRFEARLKVSTTGGKSAIADDEATVEGANDATLILVAATSFKTFQDDTADPAARCADMLKTVDAGSYDALRSAHVADHQALFRRVTLDLGQTDRASDNTAARLVRVKRVGNPSGNPKDAASPATLSPEGLESDPALAALFFQFGRYMLIASSRPGDQAANLQGVWNESLNPPWESKYTTNINLEMNYWPAETTNLSECAEPLFDLVTDLQTSGGLTAKEQYGARGWVLHHNTDLWRGTAPINNVDGVWPTGAAWLCYHLWEHYLFTKDKDFLEKRAYPAMRGAAVFFLDYLIKDPKTGFLVTNPSISPEQGKLCAGPAMDMQLIRALFDSTIEATKTLNTDADFASQLADVRKQLAPDKIGQHGQLQEWQEDIDAPNNNHRHMSPLWGMFPGAQFTPEMPDLFNAAKVLLKWRGDGSTGWSFSWRIPLWARAHDGDFAYRQLSLQLAKRTLSNLFDLCGPYQADGNFGAAAGVAEMLLQSHRRVPGPSGTQTNLIELLPALPAAWSHGSVTGLCARGGFVVDMTWDKGALTRAVVHSRLGGPCRLAYADRTIDLNTQPGGTSTLDAQLREQR